MRCLLSTEVAPKWAFLIFLLEEVLFLFSLVTKSKNAINAIRNKFYKNWRWWLYAKYDQFVKWMKKAKGWFRNQQHGNDNADKLNLSIYLCGTKVVGINLGIYDQILNPSINPISIINGSVSTTIYFFFIHFYKLIIIQILIHFITYFFLIYYALNWTIRMVFYKQKK